MISIGDVKWGSRIEPININKPPKKELDIILEKYGIESETKMFYPMDERLISVLRADKQKLEEYIKACKYSTNKKMGQHIKKSELGELSIFDDSFQINYELKHLRETVMINEEEKTEIYKRAKSTQNLFKTLGSNNVKIEINLVDRVYFEVQNFMQTVKAKRNIKALPEGNSKTENERQYNANLESSYRKALFSKEAQRATSKVSEKWKEQQLPNNEKKEREII